MTDRILIATAEGSLRVFVAQTTQLVNQARTFHQTTPVATAALGRLLTAASIMGVTLKNDTDLLTLAIKGNGPLGGVVATGDANSHVKGYVHNPLVDIPKKPNGKLDVSGAVGAGTLTVTKDLGLREPMNGQVELISGEIAEDVTYYYATSEQTPSAIGLGVLVDVDYSVKQAGGFFIQVLPDAKESVIAQLETNLQGVDAVTSLLEKMSLDEMLMHLCRDIQVDIKETRYPEYHCQCSRERAEKALISLGETELKAILAEDEKANIHCHFCNSDYNFSGPDLEAMLNAL